MDFMFVWMIIKQWSGEKITEEDTIEEARDEDIHDSFTW